MAVKSGNDLSRRMLHICDWCITIHCWFTNLGQTLGLVMETMGAGMCRNTRHRCTNSTDKIPPFNHNIYAINVPLKHKAIFITNKLPVAKYRGQKEWGTFFAPHKTNQSTYLTSDQIFSILRESQRTEGFPGVQTHDFTHHKAQHYAAQINKSQ